MKTLLEHISREVQLELIKEAYTHWQTMEPTVASETYLVELISLTYHFLKKFTVYTDEVPMFRHILSNEDISVLKEIHSYNYHKLKMHNGKL